MTKYITISILLFGLIACNSNKEQSDLKSLSKMYENAQNNLKEIERKRSMINYDQENMYSELIEETNKTIEYVDKIRTEVLELDHSGCNSISELQNPLEVEKTTNYFFGKNFESSEGIKLQIKLTEYTAFLTSKINNDSIAEIIAKQLTPLSKKVDNNYYTWESWNFENKTILECLTTLLDIEYNIRKSEYEILTNMNDKNTQANNG